MNGICPSCGFNLSADEVIERDGFTVDPRGTLKFEGRQVEHLSPFMTGIILAVARAGDRTLSIEAIQNRITESHTNIVQVMVCRIRKILAAQSVPCPITTVRGRGYAWGLPS